MGQGAGVGAALAVSRGVAARAAPVSEMQAELCRQGAVVTPPDLGELAAAGAESAARARVQGVRQSRGRHGSETGDREEATA